MRAVVECLPCSPMPEPVPIVVNEVILVCHARCWTLPQVEIEMRRHRNRLAHADALPVIRIPSLCIVRTTDTSFFQRLHRFLDTRPRPALVAHLDQPVVPGRCFH